MKSTISKIDLALKSLYNLDSPHAAEDFLVSTPLGQSPKEAPPAALYVAPPSGAEDTLSLGIYLNPDVHSQLGNLPNGPTEWTRSQFAAFSVAAEEISHFRYVVHHVPAGRGVSQLELELQGEIDRFLLAHFALKQPFSNLFQKFFEDFHWLKKLGAEERARYEEAHRLAKAYIVQNCSLLEDSKAREKLLAKVRAFYRASFSEKISQASR